MGRIRQAPTNVAPAREPEGPGASVAPERQARGNAAAVEVLPALPVLAGADKAEGGHGSTPPPNQGGAAPPQDPGEAFPFQRELEALFGESFAGVRVVFGNPGDGADAAAEGDTITLPTRQPTRAQVAHELTHVLQARRGAPTDRAVSDRSDASEVEARDAGLAATRGVPFRVRQRASAKKQFDRQDQWQEARRRALTVKDALLDHWTEDEERALDQIRGQSTLMLREIRAQYAVVTGGRVLEKDFQKYCNDGQYAEALSLLWRNLTLADRIRSQVDPGWLWDSENEQGMLDILRSASRAELDQAAADPAVMSLLRGALDEDELFTARRLLQPDQLYDIVAERIRNARGFFDDDENGVYNAVLELPMAERRRLYTENSASWTFLNDEELAAVRRMCFGTEADALDERMRLATDGLGTDDDGVALVVGKARDAAQRQEQIAAALASGVKPDGTPLTEDEQRQLREAQAATGDVRGQLLTERTDGDGELAESSFLGRLHGDVGDDEFHAFQQQMGGDSFAIARRRIIDAVGLWDDNDAIYEAFDSLVGEIALGAGESLQGLDPADRQRRQTAANRALRDRLWNDPAVQAALREHLNDEERGRARDYADADPYAIALHRLQDAYSGIDTDEEGIFRLLSQMSGVDRQRMLRERPPIYLKLTTSGSMTPQERAMVTEILTTGRVRPDRAVDWALGGDWDGTSEEMLTQTFGSLTDAERFDYRLGYWLARSGRAPADAVQEGALARFQSLERRLKGELGDDDLQKALDELVGVPTPQELETEQGRLMAAGVMRERSRDKLALTGGLASAFTESDETAELAGAQLEAQYALAMEDGLITPAELATLAALDASFASRYTEHVNTVDMVAKIAGTVAAIAAAILVTVLTGGTAGPAAAGLLSQYGATALYAGIAAAGSKVAVSEVMAGDHYDATGGEGATDAAIGFVEGATTVLSAGLASKFTGLVGLGGRGLASEMTVAALESTSGALSHAGRAFATGGIKAAVEGFIGGSVGELVMTLADAQTWRQSVWDVVCSAGWALLRGGGIGAATGFVTGGALEALSAHLSRGRVIGLVSDLEASGVARTRLEAMSMDAVEGLGRADAALAGGKVEEAEAIFRSLRGKFDETELAGIRSRLFQRHLGTDPVAAAHQRVADLHAAGAFDQSGYHGTSSDMIDGLEDTQGRLLSAQNLHDEGITQVSGEGDAFSGRAGRKTFISVGSGESGLGTSTAYSNAVGSLKHYNVQRYTLDELEEEIRRLDDLLSHWDDGKVPFGPGSYMYKSREQFQSQLDKLTAERTVRMRFPAGHPRRLGGADNVQNYPVLFEFDRAGLDLRLRPDVKAGGALGGEGSVHDAIDLKTRLRRVYCPLSRVDELSARLESVLGHGNFEVLPLEALEKLPAGSLARSSRDATEALLTDLEAGFAYSQHAYHQAMTGGGP